MLRLLAWLGSMKWEWSFIKFQLKKCTTRQWKKYCEGELYRPYYRAARVTSHTVIFLLCWKRPAVKKSISVFQRLIVWKAVLLFMLVKPILISVTELPKAWDFASFNIISLQNHVTSFIGEINSVFGEEGNLFEFLIWLFWFDHSYEKII